MEESQTSFASLAVIFLLRNSHLAEAATEPVLLREAQTNEVSQLVGMKSLLELFTLEDFYVIIEASNGLEDKVDIVFKVGHNDPVSHRE